MTTTRVFHLIAARMGVFTLAPAGVLLWAFGPPAALGGAAAAFGLELWRVRKLVVSAVPETLQFEQSTPGDHSWLDNDGFRRELAGLAALGFRPIADYTIAYPGSPDGHARLLINPELRVYAEVNQLRANGEITPVATTLVSILGEEWSLSTTSRPALATTVAFLRSPHAAWRTMPDAPPAELVTDHLATRNEMCRALNVAVGGDGSVESYFAKQRADHATRRKGLTWKTVATGIGRGVRFERRPTTSWFGEFTPSAVR